MSDDYDVYYLELLRHRRYVGPVSYISQDQSAKGNRAVVVASENGVLAAINPSSGKLCEPDSKCSII